MRFWQTSSLISDHFALFRLTYRRVNVATERLFRDFLFDLDFDLDLTLFLNRDDGSVCRRTWFHQVLVSLTSEQNTGRFEFYDPKWPHKMTNNMCLPEYPQWPTSPSENEERSKSIRAECLNVRGLNESYNLWLINYESYNMTHLYNLRTHQMFYTCRKGIW